MDATALLTAMVSNRTSLMRFRLSSDTNDVVLTEVETGLVTFGAGATFRSFVEVNEYPRLRPSTALTAETTSATHGNCLIGPNDQTDPVFEMTSTFAVLSNFCCVKSVDAVFADENKFALSPLRKVVTLESIEILSIVDGISLLKLAEVVSSLVEVNEYPRSRLSDADDVEVALWLNV